MKSKQARNLAAVFATILCLSAGFNNCGQRTQVNVKEATLLATGSLRGGTSGGNPARTTLKFGSYDDPLIDQTAGGPGTPATLTELTYFYLCISAMHFPITGGGGAELTIELNEPIALEVNPLGTSISTDLILPFGDYQGVSIDVTPSCDPDKFSTIIINSAGTFVSSKSSTMEFVGDFSSDTHGHSLTLHIGNVAQSLVNVKNVLGLEDSVDMRTPSGKADPSPLTVDK